METKEKKNRKKKKCYSQLNVEQKPTICVAHSLVKHRKDETKKSAQKPFNIGWRQGKKYKLHGKKCSRDKEPRVES